MENYKNELAEFIQNIGYLANCIGYVLVESDEYGYRVRVLVDLGKDVAILKEGWAKTKIEAEMIAAQKALQELTDAYPTLAVDWSKVYVEAQGGDALIKLAAYSTAELEDSEAKSRWLQRVESDANLVAIFDRLHKDQDLSVAIFGRNLGKKHKATWIEALIWRAFSDKGLPPFLTAKLKDVYEFLEG